MIKYYKTLLFCALCTLSSQATTLGATEKVSIVPPNASLCARIDTGAAQNSLDAQNLVIFQKNGEDWASFYLNGTNIEKKVVRYTNVTQQAGSTKRPVVILRLIMKGIDGTYAFSLADRSHLQYPVLIGRNVLDTQSAAIKVDITKNTSCR